MASSDALPVVDLAPFLTGDEGGIARATKAVREACWTHGFFRAVNHGVPAELLVRALELSAAFFALPDEEKVNVRPAAGYNTPLPAGYGQQPAHSTDKNEYLVVFDPKLGFNVYPAEPAGFRETVEECHDKLTELGWLIQEILNECMGHPRGFLRDYNDDRAFDLTIARRYFLGLVGEEEHTDFGFGAHEDAGCVTFIFQDSVGGLEVLKDGHWVPAEPIDGSIVVNIGDVIQNAGAEQRQVEERDAPGGEEAGAQALVRLLLQHPRRQVGRAAAGVHGQDRRGAALQEVPVQGVSAAACEGQVPSAGEVGGTHYAI
ncbi:unnamed protein product [Urochloa decumbens]|uniref:Fe2OG dioxygenase domain-containing protein n=1 Tax=Urochloa decumbens TaxID=240449 RepID=A0ABC9F7Z7_9POAL